MNKLDKYLLNTIFDRSDFDENQIKELELGLEAKNEITYCNPNISAKEMNKIRLSSPIVITL